MKASRPRGATGSNQKGSPAGVVGAPAKAALAVLAMLLLGRLGGLLRDLIVAPLFGAGPEVDALVAARTGPELVLALVTSGAIVSGLLPAIAHLSKGKDQLPRDGVRVISAIANWLALLTALFTLAGMAAPRFVLALLTPGLDAARLALAESMLRIMLPVTFFVTVAAILGAFFNDRGRFVLPSARALVTNTTIIAATLLLAPRFGIASVALGWTFGSFLQILLLLPSAVRIDLQYRIGHWRLSLAEAAPILRLMAPILASQLMIYGRVLLERFFASGLPAGELACLDYAYRLGTAPMLIVANAVNTVYLPLFSKLGAAGRFTELDAHFKRSVRLTMIGILPYFIVLTFFSALPLQVLLEHGSFSAAETAKTAPLLALYSMTLVGFSLAALFSQVLYGLRRGSAVLAGMGVGLAAQFAVTYGCLGWIGSAAVPVGTGGGFLVSAALLLRWIRRSLGPAKEGSGRLHSGAVLAAGGAMLLVSVAANRLLNLLPVVWPVSWSPQLASVGFGLATYGAALWFLKVPEALDLRQGLAGWASRFRNGGPPSEP